MLFRKDHHPGRVAQGVHFAAGSVHVADTVVNDQPAMPGQDGRSTAADFEPLPGGHRSRQPVMGEFAEVTWSTRFQRTRPVRDPDAFAIKIQLSGRGAASGIFGTGARKQRPMEDGELRFPGWIRNSNGEYTGVFVIHVAGIDSVIRSKSRQAQALPMKEVL